eukprot:364693-Chlamydomonas_euryale.AAC.5
MAAARSPRRGRPRQGWSQPQIARLVSALQLASETDHDKRRRLRAQRLQFSQRRNDRRPLALCVAGQRLNSIIMQDRFAFCETSCRRAVHTQARSSHPRVGGGAWRTRRTWSTDEGGVCGRAQLFACPCERATRGLATR